MAATGYLFNHDQACVERNLPPEVPFDANDKAVSGSGAACTLTVTADADRPIVVSQIHYGYDAAPQAGATLKIEDVSGTTVFQLPVVGAGPFVVEFVPNKCTSAKNHALIITLSAGGGSILAYLNANVRRHL